MIYSAFSKKFITSIIIVSFCFACSKYETVIVPSKSNSTTTEEVFDLYKMDDLPEITLTVPLKDWNILLDNFDTNPNNKEKVVSHFEFNLNGRKVKLDSIGVRLRGNTSRRRPEGKTGSPHDAIAPDWNHCHFGLDFNKFKKGQRFNALKEINLKWFKDDASYVRSTYCYDLFERFGVWTAPQASYCKITIYVEGDSSPAYYGVYAMEEAVNEDYINKRIHNWGGAVGNLWKCGYGGGGNATLESGSETSKLMGVEVVTLDGVNNESFAYDLKTNRKDVAVAKAELSDFIFQLNNKTGSDFEQWIASKMDVSLFLKTYAVNVIVGMWDDYWVNGNNFYLYMGGNGKVYFIPYDYDNTLGTSLIIGNSGTQDPLNWGGASGKPLLNKILSIAKYNAEYKSYLKELIDPTKDYFYADNSKIRIQKWQDLIRMSVPNVTNEDVFIEDKPASWSNISNYRLLSGDDLGGGRRRNDANFFKSKAKSINW